MEFFDILKSKHKINLNEQQKRAVSHKKGPALILAGPGSGKTTVITARAAYLIEQGIKPRNILTLTFNKAAQLEMESRFLKLYGGKSDEKVHFSTLHSFCNKVVRDYEKMKGQRLRRIEGNEEDINKKLLLKDIYLSLNNSKISDDDLENLINEIGFIKNKMIRNPDTGSFSSKKFLQVYKAYEEYKKSNLLIDFDDMLTYAYSILTRCPQILSYYKDRFKFIQVDEGQDLSKIQFEIIKLLLCENKNFFIVADDDQSIYGFRGAEPKYILDIKNEFSNCEIFRLEENYRSSSNVVTLSSNFIKNNNGRFNKNHSTENGPSCDPSINAALNEHKQVSFIIDKIRSQGIKTDIAILYRNNLSSILIADELEQNNIPFKIKQNRLFFFNHWLVQDMAAFLMFSLDTNDIEAFSRIYFRMNRYISKSMLESALNKVAEEAVIDSIIKNCTDLKPFQINSLNELSQEFSALSKMSPWSALSYIKNNFKYMESIKGYTELTGLSFDYLNRLFGILHAMSSNCPTISSFLVRLNELEDLFNRMPAKSTKQDDFNVTLSTFHSSKGLEYDTVFMIDLNNSEIPGEKALENNNISMLEEERRLFYVGMTRARKELFLVYPESINGEKADKSKFVGEVVQLLKKDTIDNMGEGVIVNHSKFGKGVVVAVNENSPERQTIEIKFLNGEQKKLDLQICLDNKLLRVE